MEEEHARSQPYRWRKRAAVRVRQDQEVEVLQAAAIWVGRPLAKGHGGQEEEAGDLLHLAAATPLERGEKMEPSVRVPPSLQLLIERNTGGNIGGSFQL